MDDRDVNWDDLTDLDAEIERLTQMLSAVVERQQALRAQLAINQGRVALKRQDYDGVAKAFRSFIGADDD